MSEVLVLATPAVQYATPEQVDARKELVRRLRSGEIKQTKGKLGDPNGSRCCLGVACDIGVEAGVIPAPTLTQSHVPSDYNNPDGEVHTEASLMYGSTTGSMPYQVSSYFGFNDRVGAYGDLVRKVRSGGRLIQKTLTYSNDTEGLTFSQIADIIESEPKDLFTHPSPPVIQPTV